MKTTEPQLHIQASEQDFDNITDQRTTYSPPLPSTPVITTETPTTSYYQHIWIWILLTGFTALFGGIAFDTIHKYWITYEQTPIISITLLTVNAIFLLLLLWLIAQESIAYWRIHSLISHQKNIRTQINQAHKDTIVRLLQQLDRTSQHTLSKQLHATFWASIQPHHTGAEIISIYRLLVATPLREQAEKLIQPALLQGAGISLISPNNSIHLLILLWRSAKLINEITQVYGIRPGFFGNIQLLKIALENSIVQQGADLLLDASVSNISHNLLSIIAEKSAEATITALLLRRIAKATIDELDVTREED